jgi:hypothetical protein
MSSNGRKSESSEGIEPELLIMMTCVNEGRTDDGEDSVNEGTICFNKGICERAFNFGVVMNTFVSEHQ